MAKTIISKNSIEILGVRVDNLDVDTLNSRIRHEVREGCHTLIFNVNVLALNLAYENPWLRDYLNSAKLVFCDGSGVIIGAKILGYHLHQRITYADWTWELAAFAEKEDISLFLLGAKPGVAAAAANKLSDRYNKLKILGTHHGHFDLQNGSESNEKVIQMINKLKPNILIVGFGNPIQERWLMQNWNKIDANVALTGGAVFDYISGELKRAPRIMTDNSLEWLGRFLIEPRRLWKRYLLGNPKFFYRVFQQKYLTRDRR